VNEPNGRLARGTDKNLEERRVDSHGATIGQVRS
jgi:hypothetical protein